MNARLAAVFGADERIAYALVFGSRARGTAQPGSDVDVAIGFAAGARPELMELGLLASDLEKAAGGRVDLVLLDEAPPGLAYRVFRDGRPIVVRDGAALAARRARAILEYLDFRPIEEMLTRGVLARSNGR